MLDSNRIIFMEFICTDLEFSSNSPVMILEIYSAPFSDSIGLVNSTQKVIVNKRKQKSCYLQQIMNFYVSIMHSIHYTLALKKVRYVLYNYFIGKSPNYCHFPYFLRQNWSDGRILCCLSFLYLWNLRR